VKGRYIDFARDLRDDIVRADEQNRRRLRSRILASGATLDDATRLAAIGIVLADGASEMRPVMSAKSAKAWVQRHVEDVDRAQIDQIKQSQYVDVSMVDGILALCERIVHLDA